MKTPSMALLIALLCSAGVAGAQPATQPKTMTLQEVVALAKQQNPDVVAERNSAQAAHFGAESARALRAPTVSISALATEGTSDNMLTGAPPVNPMPMQMLPADGARDINVTASLPVYTGGEISAEIARAREMAASSRYRQVSSEQNAAASAAVAFYAVQLAQETLEVERKQVAEQREQLRVARDLLDVGKAPKFYVLRAEAQLAVSEQTLHTAQADYRKSQMDLARLVGMDPSVPIVPAEIKSAVTGLQPVESYENRALTSSPVLMQAAAELGATQQTVNAARSQFRPKLYAMARYDIRASDAAAMGFDDGYTLGLSVSLPLFDAGKRRNDLNEARNRADAQQSMLESARLDVIRDVAKSYVDVQAAQSNLQLARKAVESAEEDYAVTNARFVAGKGIQVEVMSSLTALEEARRSEALRRFQALAAFAALKRAAALW